MRIEASAPENTVTRAQRNMLSAPAVPCPSPVTLAVSKTPFSSQRTGSQPITHANDNFGSEITSDKSSFKESTASRNEANENALPTSSPRVNVDSDDNGQEAGSDADVEDEDEEMMDLEVKVEKQKYSSRSRRMPSDPKRSVDFESPTVKNELEGGGNLEQDILPEFAKGTPPRSIPPPMPLLSPVYVPKPVIALDYRGNAATSPQCCQAITWDSIQSECRDHSSDQLHPLDCLFRSFARAESQQQLKHGYSNNNNHDKGCTSSATVGDIGDRKSFRNKNVLVYEWNQKSAANDVGNGAFDGIKFDSKFESGNLATAHKVPHSLSDPRTNRHKLFHQEYNLHVRNDLHTRGNTQWFFFSVEGSNIRKGMKVRFNIINMRKADSICNYGMRPCVYSTTEYCRSGRGWLQDGSDVCYYKGTTQYNDQKGKRKFHYVLSFVYEFQHANDKVFFAYNFPYTYTMLQQYLQSIERDSSKRHILRRVKLCNTLAGNACDLLTITGKTASMQEMNSRKVIVISARVHPGETVGSWMMHGLIEFLTGSSPEARALRNHFIFKLVPMLNPDGVINGNYRCSLAGVDLNRRWSKPSNIWHPTIFSLKNLIKKMHSTRGVLLYCDLHGHSRKKNIFSYACCATSAHKSLIPGDMIVPLKRNRDAYLKVREESRLFAYIMAHVKGGENSDISLSFRDSTFNVRKGKKNTARVVVWQELGVPQSFTIEASFCGAGDNRFDKRCKQKGKRAFQSGEMNYTESSGFTTAGNADDEQGFTTGTDQHFSGSKHNKLSPCSPGVKKLYKTSQKQVHYSKNDLCGFGRVIAKSLVIYFDLGVEVKKMHEYDSEQNQHHNDDQITKDFRDRMVGLRNRLLIDLRQKLSKQYDSATKAKPQVLKDQPESKISNSEESKIEISNDESESNNDEVAENDVMLELPDSDCESCGSDSEPSADNMDPSELLHLDSFHSIVARVDSRKAKQIRKAKAKASKSKKREVRKKPAGQKKLRKSSNVAMPPKRSIARDYAMVAKPYVSPKAKAKKEKTTVLWKESVSLNLFDKAMNNEKLRSTEQKFWLVNSKKDISAVLSKMSLEGNRKDGTKSYKMATKLKKKQRGYGSDRLNRASREALTSAPASLCENAGIKIPKKSSKRRNTNTIRDKASAVKNLDNTTLQARTRKTIAVKPADSDSKSESDDSVDQVIMLNESKVVENSNNVAISRASRAQNQAIEKSSKSHESRSRRYLLKPPSQSSKFKSEKVEFAAYKNTRNLSNDIEFIGIAARNNNLKRSFNKPRQPPPSFRAQSRQSYPGSSHSTRNSNAPNPTYTPSTNKTLLSLLQSKRSNANSVARHSLPSSQRLNNTAMQSANYDYRKSGSGRQARLHGHGNVGKGHRRGYS